MKFKAYYTETPDPAEVPDNSYIIIEAANLFDCLDKCQDNYADLYFWEFEEVKE